MGSGVFGLASFVRELTTVLIFVYVCMYVCMYAKVCVGHRSVDPAFYVKILMSMACCKNGLCLYKVKKG